MTWTSLFGFYLALQVVYLGLLWLGSRRAFRSSASSKEDGPPTSVVISARNEAHRIEPLLTALEAQTYPTFEVVVVDDGSTDTTQDILRQFASKHDWLRVLVGSGSGKKAALTQAISAARHELLVFTDADGRPTPQWLHSHAAAHAGTRRPAVVVGYGPLRAKPGWLGALMRFDADLTAFQSVGAIGLGRGFMAVGRNVSYPRSVFDAVDGHSGGATLLSGDDDLFVQAVRRAKAAELRYLCTPESHVPSDAPDGLRAWIRQKTRHTSAGRRFLPSVKVHLALFHGSATLLWLAPIFLGWPGLGLIAVRLGLLAAAVTPAWKRFGSMDLLPRLIVLDFLYAAYNVVVPPIGLLFGPRRW